MQSSNGRLPKSGLHTPQRQSPEQDTDVQFDHPQQAGWTSFLRKGAHRNLQKISKGRGGTPSQNGLSNTLWDNVPLLSSFQVCLKILCRNVIRFVTHNYFSVKPIKYSTWNATTQFVSKNDRKKYKARKTVPCLFLSSWKNIFEGYRLPSDLLIFTSQILKTSAGKRYLQQAGWKVSKRIFKSFFETKFHYFPLSHGL